MGNQSGKDEEKKNPVKGQEGDAAADAEEEGEQPGDDEKEELTSIIGQSKNDGIKQVSLVLRAFVESTGSNDELALTMLMVALSELASEFRSSGLPMNPEQDFCKLGVGLSLFDILGFVTNSELKKMSRSQKDLIAACFRAIGQIAKLDKQMKFMIELGLIDSIVSALNKILDYSQKLEKIEPLLFWGVNALYFLMVDSHTSNANSAGVQKLINAGGVKLVERMNAAIDGKDDTLSVHVGLLDKILFVGLRQTKLQRAPRTLKGFNLKLQVRERGERAW